MVTIAENAKNFNLENGQKNAMFRFWLLAFFEM